MTNDDRSNEDRPDDGRAPSWGEPAEEHSHHDDAPRYGERITPSSAPQSGEQPQQYGQQPQYGERTAPQQYGQQQYGQQQYGQQQGAPAWGGGDQPWAAAPAAAGAPAWQHHEEPKAKKKTVGVIAFLAAVVALVVGVVGGYVLGTALGASGALRGVLEGTTTGTDPQQLQREVMNDPAVASQLMVGSIVMWVATLFGLWGLVQGIVAIATKRGRGWGVVALVLAVVAAIVAGSVYLGVAVSTVS
ncbi:hypothetical protein [Curtobacterium sp. 9128]|uniref:hypothetical protein n=1 Tax=Curtobacterium sp. 9128 TaxID=1793722 RepID=UPI0011A73732|nr:hypothetical protein [Curtobacterium sp. 9128]